MTLQGWDPGRLDELVPMWRESFEFGVGIIDPHPLAEQREYFLTRVLPGHEVCLALHDGQLVGFAAASAESVSQLFVRVGWHGQGIGKRLLEWAKTQSNGSLWLFAFARNHKACAFYESQGFHVVARGFEPTWQLDDVKYAWHAATA